MKAQLILAKNLAKLDQKTALRRELIAASSRLNGPFFRGAPALGKPLRFHYRMTNLNAGHNLPSGSLSAQPEIWLDVALIGPNGENL